MSFTVHKLAGLLTSYCSTALLLRTSLGTAKRLS